MDDDTKLLNLALDAGEIMLTSGAETYRVQDTMLRILSVSGRKHVEALALSTMLIVSLPREEKGPLSMARGVSDRSVNFEKICAVNNMSRSFVAGKITLEEATQKVLEIHYAPSFAPWQRILGYALTSGGLTMVYNGTFWDGVGKVQDGDQWLLIDTQGNVVVDDPGFSGFYSCGNGLIAYQDAESGLWGYMTTDGKIAIEARFLTPDTFFPAD